MKFTVKLTAEQTEDLPFPIGCPVWYNMFPEKHQTSEQHLIKRGVVESVSFNVVDKDLIYHVEYNDGNEGRRVEEVAEKDLAYGSNCPVLVDCMEDGSPETKGTVLLCEPSPENSNKILYTVMMMAGGSQVWCEDGIDSKRIKYRKEHVADNAAGTSQRSDVEKDQSSPVAKRSDQNARGAEGDIDFSKKRECASSKDIRAGDKIIQKMKMQQSNSYDNPTVVQERVPQSIICGVDQYNGQESPAANRDGHISKEIHTKTANNGLADKGRVSVPNADYSRQHHFTYYVSIPTWLADNTDPRDPLFEFLNQSKNIGEPSILEKISQKTNCLLEIHSDVKRKPINVLIRSMTKKRSGPDPKDDVQLAKAELEDALVNYTRNDTSIGRLFYDIAISSSFFHQRYGMTVEQRSPYKDINNKGGSSFMNIVELPYVRDGAGRIFHHGHYILPPANVLPRLNRETGCVVKVCGREFNAPMLYSKPHVWVWGYEPNRVDAAVEILKAAIRDHRKRCNCYWEEDDRHHHGYHHTSRRRQL